MKFSRFLLFLTFTMPLTALCQERVVFEQPTLKPSEVIRWENRSGETLDALAIPGPVSIVLSHCSRVVISVCDLGSVQLDNCEDIEIRNSFIHTSKDNGVTVRWSKRIVIGGCRFEDLSSGIYALECQDLQVIGNFFANMQGPMPRGQAVQFDKVWGAGNLVSGNYAVNQYGKNGSEDVISMYMSRGQEGAPIVIESNYLVGDAQTGSKGMSKSGSGIMLGDGGGEHQTCRNNIVLAAGQVGIGVAGGRFIRVENNFILGGKSDVSNVGLYVWNVSKKPGGDIVVKGNRVRWQNNKGVENPWWEGGGMDGVEESGNRWTDLTMLEDVPPPPSKAPVPPKPYMASDGKGGRILRFPWTPK